MVNIKEFENEMSELVEDEDSVCMIPVNQTMMKKMKLWGSGEAEPDFQEETLCFI